MEYKTTYELISKAKEAEGKTFGEIDVNNRLQNEKSKGSLGQVIEESFFGYKVNSEAKPDFENLGVELKVTPFKTNKNKTLSAKERLVLNIIDYVKEAKATFETSSFWSKNEKLLLMFYEWLPDIHRKDYKIHKSMLFTYPESDLEIIRNDWEFIVEKIKQGRAHELSEADTIYLGACSKGATKNSLREQPFSSEMAMQRAFSLKQSYMTSLVREYVHGEKLVSFSTAQELRKKSFEAILNEKFKVYYGMTDREISDTVQIKYKPNTKNFIPLLISSILGIKGTKLDDIEEVSKANIEFKTVRLEPNGKPEQHMSFENIDFHRWLNETWEDSIIRQRFSQTKFLFVIFKFKDTEKQNPNRKLYFQGIKLWNMPISTIENEVKQLWEEVNRILCEGVKIGSKKYGGKLVETNNLPKTRFNDVMHIRSKGKNGQDKVLLPDGQYITKQCFWLNNTYIESILKDC